MIKGTETLARIYGYILSKNWGNKEAGCQRWESDNNRLESTDRGGLPANPNIAKMQVGSQGIDGGNHEKW